MAYLGNRDLLQAHLDLMDRMIITESDDPEAYRRIQRYSRELERWHHRFTGWRLHVFRGVARLARIPAIIWAGGGIPRFSNSLDYACLTMALWFYKALAVREVNVETPGERFLMSHLAEQVTRRVEALPEPFLNFTHHTHRLSMARALKFLEETGALVAIHGEADDWVHERNEADVLYLFTEAAEWLAYSVDETTAQVLTEMPAYPHREPRLTPQLEPERRVWRSLLLGPALYRVDDPDAFTYLVGHSQEVGDRLYDTFGWFLDLHRDYAAVVRADQPQGERFGLLDFRGASGDIVRLACSTIRQAVQQGHLHPDDDGGIELANAHLDLLLSQIRGDYGQHWGKRIGELSAARYVEEVAAAMRRYGFLRGPDAHGRCYITPLAARYAGEYVEDALEPHSHRGKQQREGSPSHRAAEQSHLF